MLSKSSHKHIVPSSVNSLFKVELIVALDEQREELVSGGALDAFTKVVEKTAPVSIGVPNRIIIW